MGGETLAGPKRIDRRNDKLTYQPRIHSERIHQLYELGKQYNLPMTVILDMALEQFINQLNQQDNE